MVVEAEADAGELDWEDVVDKDGDEGEGEFDDIVLPFPFALGVGADADVEESEMIDTTIGGFAGQETGTGGPGVP